MEDREKLSLAVRLALMQAYYEGKVDDDVRAYLRAHGITQLHDLPAKYADVETVTVKVPE